MEKEYSLSSLFTRLYSDCNVKTKNEFINFVKSRRVNSHICLNYITKKDISFQFTDYVNDTESIVCKECYLNVLEKFQNLNIKVYEKFNGYCDCGDDLSMEKKVFCSNHKGKFSTKSEIDKFISDCFIAKLSPIPTYLNELVEMLNILIVKYGDFLFDNAANNSQNQSQHMQQAENTSNAQSNSGDFSMISAALNNASNTNNTAESFNLPQEEEEEVEESISDVDSVLIYSDKLNKSNSFDESKTNIGNTFLFEIDSLKYPIFRVSNVLFLPQNQIIELIDCIMSFLTDLVKKTLHLGVTLLLGRLFSNQSNVMTTHECFSSNEDEIEIKDEGTFHKCRCSLIQNLVRYSNVYTGRVLYLKQEGMEPFANFLYIMIKSPEFKEQLTFSCIVHFSNYLYTAFQQWYSANLFFYTKEIEDLSDVKMNFLLGKFMNVVDVLLKDTSFWGSDINLGYNVLVILKKIFLFSHSFRITDNLIYMKKIVDWLEDIHYSKILERNNENLNNSGFADGDNSYTELYVLQLFSLFVREFDFSKEQNVKEILLYLYEKIKDNADKLEKDKFTFNTTLQRTFSLFINKMVLSQSVYSKKSFNEGIKEIFMYLSAKDEEVINYLLFPVLKCVHFINEIKKEKWSHYGTNMIYYYIIYYHYFDIWILCDMNLIKMIFSYFSYTNKKIDINEIMKLFDFSYEDISNFENSDNFFVYKKDLEFLFRAMKNEENIIDLLLFPYSFFLQKNINFQTDELYEYAVQNNSKIFNKNFEQRLNQIIVANNNSATVSKIDSYLPLYYRHSISSLEAQLSKSFEVSIEDNKIHYSSKDDTHVDRLSVIIKGLNKGIKSYLISSNLPIIKSKKMFFYPFINCDCKMFFTEENLFFFSKLLCNICKINVKEFKTQENMYEHRKLIFLILHLIVVILREIPKEKAIFDCYIDNKKFSTEVIQQYMKPIYSEKDLLMKNCCDYVIDKINKSKAKRILKQKEIYHIIQTKKKGCGLCEEKIIKNYGYIGCLSKSNSFFIQKLKLITSILSKYKTLNVMNEGSIYEILVEYKRRHSYTNFTYSFKSCFHCVHFDCYDNINEEAKCPLCDKSKNVFVPDISEKDTEAYANIEELINQFKDLSKKEIIEIYHNKTMKSLQLDKNFEKFNPKILNSFLINIVNEVTPMDKIKTTRDMLKRIKEIYSIFNKIFFDIVIVFEIKESKDMVTFSFLKNFILCIRLLCNKESGVKTFFIQYFMSLLFKLDKFANEDNIVELIESDYLLASIMIELSFLLLILFDFKENEKHLLKLPLLKLLPFIFLQLYVKNVFVKTGEQQIKKEDVIEYFDSWKEDFIQKHLRETYLVYYVVLKHIALFSILSDSNQAIEEFFFFFETKKEINEICEIFQNKRICQLNLNSIEGYMNNILGNLNEQFHNIVMLYLKVKEKEMKKDKKFKYNVSLITFLDK